MQLVPLLFSASIACSVSLNRIQKLMDTAAVEPVLLYSDEDEPEDVGR